MDFRMRMDKGNFDAKIYKWIGHALSCVYGLCMIGEFIVFLEVYYSKEYEYLLILPLLAVLISYLGSRLVLRLTGYESDIIDCIIRKKKLPDMTMSSFECFLAQYWPVFKEQIPGCQIMFVPDYEGHIVSENVMLQGGSRGHIRKVYYDKNKFVVTMEEAA